MENNEKLDLDKLLQMLQGINQTIALNVKEAEIRAKEADKRAAEAEIRSKEADKTLEELKRTIKEQSKSIKEQGKQIGGLHNSLGEYTENFLKVSIDKLLLDNFMVESCTHDFRVRKDGKEIQIDTLGYSNSTKNELYIVELKTKLLEEDIEQLDKIIDNYAYFLPEHKDKKVYGLIAAIKYDQRVVNKVLDKGYYFAHIADDMLVLDVPQNFVAKSYSKS